MAYETIHTINILNSENMSFNCVFHHPLHLFVDNEFLTIFLNTSSSCVVVVSNSKNKELSLPFRYWVYTIISKWQFLLSHPTEVKSRGLLSFMQLLHPQCLCSSQGFVSQWCHLRVRLGFSLSSLLLLKDKPRCFHMACQDPHQNMELVTFHTVERIWRSQERRQFVWAKCPVQPTWEAFRMCTFLKNSVFSSKLYLTSRETVTCPSFADFCAH